jgi:hypothetical protein
MYFQEGAILVGVILESTWIPWVKNVAGVHPINEVCTQIYSK